MRVSRTLRDVLESHTDERDVALSSVRRVYLTRRLYLTNSEFPVCRSFSFTVPLRCFLRVSSSPPLRTRRYVTTSSRNCSAVPQKRIVFQYGHGEPENSAKRPIDRKQGHLIFSLFFCGFLRFFSLAFFCARPPRFSGSRSTSNVASRLFRVNRLSALISAADGVVYRESSAFLPLLYTFWQ